MRILIIHQNFVDHQHPGGTRHLDIARRLVRKGHEVTIVASQVDYLTGRRIADRGVELYDGVQVVRAYAIPSVQRGLIWRTISYLSFLPCSFWTAMKVGPVDLVLGTTPPIFQLPSTWLVALLRRAPFVLEVLDLWPEFAIGMGVLKNRLLIWLARRAEWFFYRVARQLVVNSPAYRDYLVRGGIDPELVTFIPMGVDPELFTPDSQGQDVRQQLGLADKFIVTYAGALGMANDLDTVIRAAEILRDVPRDLFPVGRRWKRTRATRTGSSPTRTAECSLRRLLPERAGPRFAGRIECLPGHAAQHPRISDAVSQQSLRLHGGGAADHPGDRWCDS